MEENMEYKIIEDPGNLALANALLERSVIGIVIDISGKGDPNYDTNTLIVSVKSIVVMGNVGDLNWKKDWIIITGRTNFGGGEDYEAHLKMKDVFEGRLYIGQRTTTLAIKVGDNVIIKTNIEKGVYSVTGVLPASDDNENDSENILTLQNEKSEVFNINACLVKKMSIE